MGIISQPGNRSVEESDQPDGILSKRKSLGWREYNERKRGNQDYPSLDDVYWELLSYMTPKSLCKQPHIVGKRRVNWPQSFLAD